ncbi:hypothetical protein L6164_028693 [Bauhinia variegata]|uniref:Uncharacterized protein n=1 Tax=Bauhinia variegata TaxID=167791 RepID=A0ACB9L7I8_BAUVA|nr:hypothetical protein L6164_028693 [Bauhinia variegata]
MKGVLAQETDLEPKEQKISFRRQEKDNEERLDMVGLQDNSTVTLSENPASKERKLDEMQSNKSVLKVYDAVSDVRTEVDKLYEKVVAMEKTICNGTKVADQEFVILTELLMVQLLKLDSTEAEGEAKAQRRIEVCRIQSYVDTLDSLRARNSNPVSNVSKTVSVTTKWETLESGNGSLKALTPIQSSTVITQDWELFD